MAMIDPSAARTPSASDVCLVLVTYHPDAGFPARFARLRPQVGGAVLVDNGSADAQRRMLAALDAESLTVLFNGANLGIARAFNLGIERARAAGFSRVLLMDQDSAADPDMVEQLLAARASAVAAGSGTDDVAVVGAAFRDAAARPDDTRVLGPSVGSWHEVESVVSSGSLLSLALHERIGAFRDEFFIDYVDTEYCLRARRLGLRIIQTRRPLMSHTVGAPTRHTALGAARWTTNHSPDRRYYIARNNTTLLREYGAHGRRAWRLKSVMRSLRLCKRIFLYEEAKLAKIRAVVEGWWDGVRGRLGPRRP